MLLDIYLAKATKSIRDVAAQRKRHHGSSSDDEGIDLQTVAAEVWGGAWRVALVLVFSPSGRMVRILPNHVRRHVPCFLHAFLDTAMAVVANLRRENYVGNFEKHIHGRWPTLFLPFL